MEKSKSVLNKKGVAGLDLALSVITILFVIGLLVMIFALMGAELQETAWADGTGNSTNQSTSTVVNETGAQITDTLGLRNCALAIAYAVNTSSDAAPIPAANYTSTGCLVQLVDGGDAGINNTIWNITGTWAFDEDSTASTVINDTTVSLGDATDWFPIVIVITFMVVLILLTVMIIRAIRGSGLMSEGA